jgi:hypothetical protein
MNKQQLCILRQEISQCKKTFEARYQDATYNVHGVQHCNVDGVLILFEASCLLTHGLTTTNWVKHGCHYGRLEKQNVLYHLNATMFTIINACNMRSGAAYAADDPSFIVLTETKFSFRCIPVWDRYSPHRTRVEKKSTCDNALLLRKHRVSIES